MPYVSRPRGTTSRSLGRFRRTFWYPPPPPPHDSLCDSRSMYRHLRRPVGEGRRRWEKWTFFQFFSLPTSFWVFRLPTSFRIPPADLLPIFVFLLTSFWDFRLPTTFRDFRLPTTFSGPPGGFLKKIEKNRRLPVIFRYIRLPTTFLNFRLPTTFKGPPDVFFEKKRKNIYPNMQDSPFLRNFLKISTYRRPTDDLMRFPPPEDLQKTSRHLFKKKSKKISVLLYKIPEV